MEWYTVICVQQIVVTPGKMWHIPPPNVKLCAKYPSFIAKNKIICYVLKNSHLQALQKQVTV